MAFFAGASVDCVTARSSGTSGLVSAWRSAHFTPQGSGAGSIAVQSGGQTGYAVAVTGGIGPEYSNPAIGCKSVTGFTATLQRMTAARRLCPRTGNNSLN